MIWNLHKLINNNKILYKRNCLTFLLKSKCVMDVEIFYTGYKYFIIKNKNIILIFLYENLI